MHHESNNDSQFGKGLFGGGGVGRVVRPYKPRPE